MTVVKCRNRQPPYHNGHPGREPATATPPRDPKEWTNPDSL
jgi:hypothetical protein